MAAGILPKDLVPFRWPAGWTQPRLVSELEGGPINCIVVGSWSEQISEAARKAGLTVIDSRSLGTAPLAQVNRSATNPVVAVADLAWPRLKPMAYNGRDQVEAGPTGAPWIDSNSWVARLAAALAPEKPIWLGFDPPEKEDTPGESAYRVAIADAAAAGARWIVSLGDKLSQALAQGNAEAIKMWRSILATLTFFERHAAWQTYRPQGPLAIILSFSGDNEYMATELLNLAARRNLLYRIIDRSRAQSADLTDLRGVLWFDGDLPTPEIVAKLSGFARQGGVVIVPRTAASVFKVERALDGAVAGYDVRALGQGRIATATRDWDDPYYLAADAHNIVGRRYDPIRIFSGAACRVHYSVAPSGRDSLFQIVNFSWSRALGGMMGTGEISFRIPAAHRSITLHTLGEEPRVLQPVKERHNTEYQLPPFGPYAALEVKA